jgi:hypothetical protein
LLPLISGPGKEAPAAVPPAKTALEIVGKGVYDTVGENAARNLRAVEAVRLDIFVHDMEVGGGPNSCMGAREESEH